MESIIGEARSLRAAPCPAEVGAVVVGLSQRLRGCFASFSLAASFAVTGGYPTTSVAFEASQYFPLASDDHWDYQVTPTGINPPVPVRAGSATVLNGTTAARQVALQGFETNLEFYTNDSAGLRLQRFDEANTQHAYSPPVEILGP